MAERALQNSISSAAADSKAQYEESSAMRRCRRRDEISMLHSWPGLPNSNTTRENESPLRRITSWWCNQDGIKHFPLTLFWPAVLLAGNA